MDLCSLKKWQVKPLVPLDEYGEVSAIDGYDIRTTLDVDLQDVVEAALRDGVEWNYAKAGTAILMDVKTGEIKALANYPETYNHAIATRLEPGSTFKIVSATALLEDRLVDYCDTIDTGDGKINFDDKEITDNGHVYGEITFEKAIAVSSNVAVSKRVSEVYGKILSNLWHISRISVSINLPITRSKVNPTLASLNQGILTGLLPTCQVCLMVIL